MADFSRRRHIGGPLVPTIPAAGLVEATQLCFAGRGARLLLV
jgi:hypothetical protein